MAEALILQYKLEESAFLGIRIIKRCRFNGTIKINRPANQRAFSRNLPDLAIHLLAHPYPMNHIRMINDEPKERPRPRFRRQIINIITRHECRESRGFTDSIWLSRPAWVKHAPARKGVLPDQVRSHTLSAWIRRLPEWIEVSSLASVPVIVFGIGADFQSGKHSGPVLTRLLLRKFNDWRLSWSLCSSLLVLVHCIR